MGCLKICHFVQEAGELGEFLSAGILEPIDGRNQEPM